MSLSSKEAIQKEYFERKERIYQSADTEYEVQRFVDFCRGIIAMARIQNEATDQLETQVDTYRNHLEQM